MKDVKNILRNNAKIIRNNIDKETCSAQIVKHILNWSIYKSSHNIMLFYPLGSEISLLELLKDSDKNFYFPVVEDDSIYPVLYDSKIQKLIGSITMWFLPMSVLMFLETKGKVNYKYRLLQVLTLNIRT